MEVIDVAAWERREAYEMFSKIDYPFYAVTLTVDVTNVKRISKDYNLSFYHLMIWICTKAVNSVPQFRLRIREEKVVRLDQTKPSFTSMKKNSEQFQIVTIPWKEECITFCEDAKKRSEEQTGFLSQAEEKDDLIYYSCTPWFDFTALTNEHNFDKDDTIPRITWGKYYEENGKILVHMTIEVNHRTIDGIHIGKFKEAIDEEIKGLSNSIIVENN